MLNIDFVSTQGHMQNLIDHHICHLTQFWINYAYDFPIITDYFKSFISDRESLYLKLFRFESPYIRKQSCSV